MYESSEDHLEVGTTIEGMLTLELSTDSDVGCTRSYGVVDEEDVDSDASVAPVHDIFIPCSSVVDDNV
jgi:hypothetical protein